MIMHIMTILLTLATISAFPRAALALDACALPVGSAVAASDLDELLSTTVTQEPLVKDEFETTAQFEARVAAATEGIGSTDFILKTAVDYDQAIYDADVQTWRFTKYFPSNGSWNFVEETLEANGLLEVGDYRSVILRSEETETGDYAASNAMGAEIKVSVVAATRLGLVEIAKDRPKSDPWDDYTYLFKLPSLAILYSDLLNKDEVVHVIAVPMPIDRARELKGKMTFAAVGTLDKPPLIRHTRHVAPTFDNPREVDVQLTYLVGDIRCGLILDDADKIVAVVGTNAPF